MSTAFSRRTILSSSVLAATAGLTGKGCTQELQPSGQNSSSDVAPREPDFQYSYRKTNIEWRAKLTDSEYRILREGETERPKSNPLWNEERAGDYRCKGCDLLIYSSEYKVNLDKGWVFFRQSEPDSVLMGIDLVTTYGGIEKSQTAIEAHCRRCASHLGHILYLDDEILHCINGTSLSFVAT